MKLNQAVATGRRIRRIGDLHWIEPGTFDRYAITLAQAADNQWEIEPFPEKKIEITRNKIVNAWNNNFDESWGLDRLFNKMIKELGFDE